MTWRALDRLVGVPERFFERCEEGLPEVFGNPGLPHEMPDLDDLAGALRGGLLRTPYVEMVREGAMIPAYEFCTERVVASAPEEGFADPERVMRLLGDGATLLLPQLDHWHASVGALTARLAHDLGRRVEAFCFATMAGGRGLDVHRDDADVLVVQLAGRKEWTVYAAPADGHWGPGPVPEPGEPLLRTVVGVGDVLYVPRGAPHTATGHEGLSVHIALTIRETSTARIRQTLADLLTQDPGGLPARPLTEGQLLASIRDVLDSARKALDSVAPEELLARARGPLPDLPGSTAPAEWPTA